MSQGERAERQGHNREYWSRRLAGMYPWGRLGKWLTHRRERAEKRRIEHKALRAGDEETGR